MTLLTFSYTYSLFANTYSARNPVYFYFNVELDNKATLSEHILTTVLGLLRKEVPEHGRHLQQYFQLFLMYSTIGPPEVSLFHSLILLNW